ncbi:hypothetical protein QQP08_016800 [Theobroma cacao]|nr:hypothetical protein QQP08_016800 [Theobroma cacao]
MGTKYTDEEAARPVGFKFEIVDLSLSLSSLKVYNGRLRLKFLLHCIGSSTRSYTLDNSSFPLSPFYMSGDLEILHALY